MPVEGEGLRITGKEIFTDRRPSRRRTNSVKALKRQRAHTQFDKRFRNNFTPVPHLPAVVKVRGVGGAQPPAPI